MGIDPQVSADHAAVIMVDYQAAFFEPRNPFLQAGLVPDLVGQRDSLVGHARAVLDAARSTNRAVVYVSTAFRADGADCLLAPRWKAVVRSHPNLLAVDSDGARVLDEVRPERRDLVINKLGHGAFQFTALDRLLKDRGIDTCIFMGNLPASAEETLRQAAAKGYDTLVVSDASFPSGWGLLEHLRRVAYEATAGDVVAWLAKVGELPGADAQTCLLVIDMQNDFLHPDGSQYRCNSAERDGIIDNVKGLIDLAHGSGRPVVYIRSQRGKDRLVDTASSKLGLRLRPEAYRTDGSWGAEIVEELTPQPDDHVVIKRGHSAFGTTHLDRMLRNLGVGTIVAVGGSSRGCLADTGLEGAALGYRVIVPEDATFPPNSPYLSFGSLGSRMELVSTATASDMLSDLAAADLIGAKLTDRGTGE